MMFSAAAIAVVSEVNPDEPGASLSLSFLKAFALLLFFLSMATRAFAQIPLQTAEAMKNAIYNNTLIDITPMLFHHLELGMSYEAIVNTLGKSALYCDSGESYCNADEGQISKKCLEAEFIQPNKNWVCHWDGSRSGGSLNASLDVWFVGVRASQIAATMPNGNTYRRDSGNTIYLDRHETT
jgi:hypothetical protein